MLLNPDLYSKVESVFFPHFQRAKHEMRRHNIRLSHYTTADTAIKIIEGSEFWMRNTSVMNDYMEVKHGADCIREALETNPGKKLYQALEHCRPGLAPETITLFEQWLPSMLTGTFVASFSQHTDDEDELGRLSMWRAYGGTAGVALIFKNGPFIQPTLGVNLTSSPVAYIGAEEVAAEVRTIAGNIGRNMAAIMALGPEHIKGYVFAALRAAALCTKHPAFMEEQEWRVIASPAMHPSKDLEPVIHTIGGVPQPIVKLRLKDQPERGLHGLHLRDFLDRVLIGPCEHSEIIRTALIMTMAKAGIPDPASRIIDTKIPLRPNQRRLEKIYLLSSSLPALGRRLFCNSIVHGSSVEVDEFPVCRRKNNSTDSITHMREKILTGRPIS